MDWLYIYEVYLCLWLLIAWQFLCTLIPKAAAENLSKSKHMFIFHGKEQSAG